MVRKLWKKLPLEFNYKVAVFALFIEIESWVHDIVESKTQLDIINLRAV